MRTVSKAPETLDETLHREPLMRLDSFVSD